jgi:hypothetical protein
MRRSVLLGAALLTALTLGLLAVAPAWAQPTRSTRSVAASPVVIQNLGRRLISTNLESGASVQCSAQGQLVDTNGNGIADSLRGRAACLENRGVARLRLYYVRVQSQFADTWATALSNGTDVVSDAQPAYVVSYTPSSRFCPPPGNFNLTYRVTQAYGIRSLDGSLAAFAMVSYTFQARAIDAARNDVC